MLVFFCTFVPVFDKNCLCCCCWCCGVAVFILGVGLAVEKHHYLVLVRLKIQIFEIFEVRFNLKEYKWWLFGDSTSTTSSKSRLNEFCSIEMAIFWVTLFEKNSQRYPSETSISEQMDIFRFLTSGLPTYTYKSLTAYG